MMSSNSSSVREMNNQAIMNIKEKEEYIENFEFPHCDETSKYERVAKIGQGTFGSVHNLALYCSFLSLFDVSLQEYFVIMIVGFQGGIQGKRQKQPQKIRRYEESLDGK